MQAVKQIRMNGWHSKDTSSWRYFESHKDTKLKSGADVIVGGKREKRREDRTLGTPAFRAVLLKLGRASESPGGPLRMQTLTQRVRSKT